MTDRIGFPRVVKISLKFSPAFILLLCACLVSGYSLSVVGQLFIGDIIVSVVLVLVMLLLLGAEGMKVIPWREVLLIGCLPLLGVLFDLYNAIYPGDMLRGFARNSIFAAAILAFYLMGRIWKLDRILLITGFFMIGMLIASAIQGELVGKDATQIVKFYGGTAIPFLAIVMLRRWFLWQCLVGFAMVFLYFFVLDSRGGAAIWAVSSVVSLAVISRAKTVNRHFFLFGIICAVVFSLVVIFVHNHQDEAFEARRELSNERRAEMAKDAFQGFLDRPLVGYGSWQHARNYIEEDKVMKLVGVHSYILQLGYEYGIFGLSYGIGLVVLIGIAYRNCITMLSVNSLTKGQFVILTYLALLSAYAVINSPFAGFSRLTTGMAIGCLLAAVHFGKNKNSIQEAMTFKDIKDRRYPSPTR